MWERPCPNQGQQPPSIQLLLQSGVAISLLEAPQSCSLLAFGPSDDFHSPLSLSSFLAPSSSEMVVDLIKHHLFGAFPQLGLSPPPMWQ